MNSFYCLFLCIRCHEKVYVFKFIKNHREFHFTFLNNLRLKYSIAFKSVLLNSVIEFSNKNALDSNAVALKVYIYLQLLCPNTL